MNEQISILLQRKWVVPTSVGIVSFLGGGVLGYILGKKRTENKLIVEFTEPVYDLEPLEELEEKIEELKEMAEDLEEMRIIPLRSNEGDDPEDHPQVVVVHLEPDDAWDMEAEMQTRTKDEPYIIHRDEFFADEMGYTQSTVTYYSGDDIMTDELDAPIYGHTAMVGELKFGHGSGDQNVVYIRSELLEHEYEVLLSYGRYEVEVLGHEIDEQYKDQDLKHSNIRKFRMD